MYTSLFYVIIGILLIEFITSKFFDYLNSTWRNKPIPKSLNGIYDDEKYAKQQKYAKINDKFSSISSTFSLIVTLLFFFLFGFEKLNDYLALYIQNPVILGLVFFGVLFLASDILGAPFDIYHTFVIEQRFGFNKTTPKTFILDKIKGYFLSIILGIIIYTIVYKFYETTQENFWIYVWMVITVIMLFFTLFYSNLIVPLFNKQKPLEDGELKEAIQKFADSVGFKLDNIYEIDGSKRSTRANAYFTGLGPKKRIVLYDTLIKDLTTHEIVAVLAHEIGHYKNKHTLKGFIVSIMQMGFMLFILSLFISSPALYQAVGLETPQFHISLIIFGILYTPLSTIIGLVMNIFSRKNEYEADDFAADNYDPIYLVSSLKKLSANNLSNLTPHPAYIFVNYSHPDLASRVKNLLKNMN